MGYKDFRKENKFMGKTIFISIQPSQTGGGPSIFVHKFVQAVQKLGHKVIYDKSNRADVALAVIETGKILRQVNRDKTRVVLRTNGIYNQEYNEKFNRKIRPDMIALHNKLRTDIPSVDFVVYQSSWSKDRIDDEIGVSNKNWSIIHNGVDTKIFTPIAREDDGAIHLLHLGLMRDSYLMETLVGVQKESIRRGIKSKLFLVGTMDAVCSEIFKKNKDSSIIHMGSFPNSQLPKVYSMGDIFLSVRMGCSCSNVVSESQACGLATICPSWGGDKEMLSGMDGKVVEGGHWDYNKQYISNIVDAIETIAPSLNEYKQNARKNAIDNLSLDAMVKKYLVAMKLGK